MPEVGPGGVAVAKRLSRGLRPVALSLAAVLFAAGCGRSAPETAQTVEETDVEPVTAGVQVVSEEPIIVPPPTTAPPVTTSPTTATTVPAAPAGSYIVEAGDTLSVIADRFGVSIEALQTANGLSDVNTIRPGQELVIPAAG